MPTLQYVAGNPNSPVPGSTTFQTDLLRNCIVEFLIVNNVNETCLGGAFSFSTALCCVTRNNPYVAGDEIIIVYSKCQCN